MSTINVIDALESPELLGALPTFRDLRPWRAWLAFLRALYGLPLGNSDRELFLRCTKRAVYAPPSPVAAGLALGSCADTDAPERTNSPTTRPTRAPRPW